MRSIKVFNHCSWFISLNKNGDILACVCSGEDAISGDKYDCTFDNQGIEEVKDVFDGNYKCLTQSTDDSFDWSLGKGHSPSRDTGPGRPFNGEYFLYIDASDKQANDYARFSLPRVKHSGRHCLSFMYHMYGEDINTLQVFDEGRSGKAVVWEEHGPQEDRWLPSNLVIDMRHEHRIVFQATVGSGPLGDIALDDIKMQSC